MIHVGKTIARFAIPRFVLAAFGVMALAFAAQADTYPSHSVRVVVPYPAGGTTDIMARLLSNYLTEKLGHPFVVENKPGGGTNIGTGEVLASAPDGYTLLIASPANAINASLYKRMPFNFLEKAMAIGAMVRVPNVMVVPADLPVKTVQEFIDYAKKNTGKINMASSGNGSSIHLGGELFKAMTGVQMVHVPYKGSAPALTDLVGGQVQVMFDNLPSSIGFIKAGKLRALGVTTSTSVSALPGVPPVGDTVKGFEAAAWFGFAGPKGIPADIVTKLNKLINDGLKDPAIHKRIEELGGIPFYGSAADFDKFIEAETVKWAPVVKKSGATVD